jgi:mono/diheme cytochrome c family protein
MQKNPYSAPGNRGYGSGGMNQPYGRSPGWNDYGMRGNGQRGGWKGYDNCMGGYNNGYAPGQTPSSGIPPATSQDVSFRADVQPIFNSRCVSCHGGTEGIYLDNYPNVMNGSNSWPVIIPGDPINSRLIQLVSSKNMPYGGPPLSEAQIQILVDWVAAGAPNN